MFDGLDDIDTTVLEEKPKAKFTKFFKKKEEDVAKDPYLPVSIFIDRDYPTEIKEKIYHLINKLLARKISVRINGDDLEFYNRIKNLSDTHLEYFIPWKGFNNIDTKYYFNTATAKQVAELNFIGWEKLPESVKAMLARNVRMIFGDKNNSISLCVILWTKDGASKISEITRETGKNSFIIKLACTYGFPVINLRKEKSMSILEKTFSL